MEKFIVSARKYRPTTFESVVGQGHITTTLKNAIKSNHLAQAFLFCGPRGVGKTTNARILAKTINCTNLTEDTEACDQCESCKAFNNNASFNIHELDAASNNSVDDIRNLVEQVRYAPQSGKYKVYIIDEVHMLSNQAFNAFLKTLEEPPSYAIFILATTEKHKIIPTILSRCQIFDFNRIGVKDIATHLANIALKESIETEAEALHLIAQKADGALRDALSIFDLIVTFAGNKVGYKDVIDNLHILDYDYYFRATDMLLKEDMPNSLLLFDEILRKGFDGHHFIVGLAEHFRNLMVCKDSATVSLLDVADGVRMKYAEQANQANLSFLLTALNLASECDRNFKASKNQRLHVELALMKLASIPAALNLAQHQETEKKKKPLAPRPQASGANPSAQVPTPKSTPAQPAQTQNQAPATPVAPPSVPKPPAPQASPARSQPVQQGGGSMRSTTRLPSLNELRQQAQPTQQPERPATQGATTPETEVADNPNSTSFTPENFDRAWEGFRNEMVKQENMIGLGVMKQPYKLGENGVVKITLSNSLQENFLENFRSELIGFLRKRLGGAQIRIETEVSKEQASSRPYTPRERFNHMAKKQPALAELQKRLGLETEF
ncbi:DNA polymerase III subunit gamma/tau [Fulvitalea axinellae]|uniref:DNA polymerase III subunit gamma/tau n=1 Tax=Fulvitalea axinellae TaxID=1182444 RepID=A0AAU9CY96_9BACT|nr:DNA polymerase III subunit gamma/tau [Fulvitalea axinellae]